jgi:hypothetical protein
MISIVRHPCAPNPTKPPLNRLPIGNQRLPPMMFLLSIDILTQIIHIILTHRQSTITTLPFEQETRSNLTIDRMRITSLHLFDKIRYRSLEVHPETRLFQKVGFLAPLAIRVGGLRNMGDDFDRALLDRAIRSTSTPYRSQSFIQQFLAR